MRLTLVSWNVAGRKTRLADQIRWVQSTTPDLVTLQEIRPSTIAGWQSGLIAAGLPHIACSLPLNITDIPPRRRRGVMVAARWPITVTTEPIGPWPEKVIAAEVASPTQPVRIVTAYVPPGSSNDWVKIDVAEAVLDFMNQKSSSPTVLTGD